MPLILGTNSIKDTGYDVANSLRFNIGSTDYLNRTSGTSSNTNVWSLSMWIKRSDVSSSGSQKVFSAGSGSTDRTEIYFGTDDKLNIFRNISGSEINIATSMVFRDPSSWYHTLWVWNGTAITLYVNGASVTLSATNLGTNKINGSSTVHRIGIQHDNSSQNFGGYLAEVTFLDATAVSDATSFGEFDDSGIWKPIDVSGLTFGTNGFYLDFEDSSALGNDAAGSNNFTVNNLTAIDQSTDTCTNNGNVMNSLDTFYSTHTFSEGNLKVNIPNSTVESFSTSTFGMSSGKWYWECKVGSASGTERYNIGIIDRPSIRNDMEIGKYAEGYAINTVGNVTHNDAEISGSWSSYTANDIIGVALDLDNNRLFFSKNGTFQNSGDPTSSTGAITVTAPSSLDNGNYFCACGDSSNGGGSIEFNFGSPPYTISSGNSDGNGYGNFEYAVPSGYYALNTKNLAEYG